MGYGVFQVTQEECERCVLDALKTGYRAIDTAQSYFNEEQVGAAIEKSGVDRKDIFLTTKVWIEHYGYEKPRLTDTQILSLYTVLVSRRTKQRSIKQFVALYEIVMISSFWEVIIRRFYFRTLATILLDIGDFLSGRISNRVVGLLYCKTF